MSAFHVQATDLRALYIFTQVILLTTYEVLTNYQALVKYERETQKDVCHLAQHHKASKCMSWHFEPREFGFRICPLDHVMHSPSRLHIRAIIVQTTKLADKRNVPFT